MMMLMVRQYAVLRALASQREEQVLLISGAFAALLHETSVISNARPLMLE